MQPGGQAFTLLTTDRVRHALEVTGLLQFFDPHVFSATMVDRGKPAPDVFLFAAQKFGVSPGDCLVIEDSVNGVTAARAAGMNVLGSAEAAIADPVMATIFSPPDASASLRE